MRKIASRSGERAAFHFFALVFLLGFLLLVVIFVNHWSKVGDLHHEVLELRQEVADLQKKVSTLEIRVQTEEILNRGEAAE